MAPYATSAGTALWKGNQWNTAWCKVSLDHDGSLSIAHKRRLEKLKLELGDSAFVEVFATDQWLCAVGAAGRQIAMANSTAPGLRVVALIDRFETGVDSPFGNHAVRFHSRPGHEQVVLSWEYGLALLDPLEGCRWSLLHGNQDVRLLKVGANQVELMAPGSSLTVDLATGQLQVVQAKQLAVDREVFRHWRSSIGA